MSSFDLWEINYEHLEACDFEIPDEHEEDHDGYEYEINNILWRD